MLVRAHNQSIDTQRILVGRGVIIEEPDVQLVTRDAPKERSRQARPRRRCVVYDSQRLKTPV